MLSSCGRAILLLKVRANGLRALIQGGKRTAVINQHTEARKRQVNRTSRHQIDRSQGSGPESFNHFFHRRHLAMRESGEQSRQQLPRTNHSGHRHTQFSNLQDNQPVGSREWSRFEERPSSGRAGFFLGPAGSCPELRRVFMFGKR